MFSKFNYYSNSNLISPKTATVSPLIIYRPASINSTPFSNEYTLSSLFYNTQFIA